MEQLKGSNEVSTPAPVTMDPDMSDEESEIQRRPSTQMKTTIQQEQQDYGHQGANSYDEAIGML